MAVVKNLYRSTCIVSGDPNLPLPYNQQVVKMGDLRLMKPMWEGAPGWAQYLAMNADLSWTWYYMKPTKENGYWRLGVGGKKMLIKKCMCSDSYIGEDGSAWESSLEERPEHEHGSRSSIKDILKRLDSLEAEVFYPEED